MKKPPVFARLKTSKKIILSFLFLLLVVGSGFLVSSYISGNHPTISDVLTKGEAPQAATGSVNPTIFLFGGAFLALIALTVTSLQVSKDKKHSKNTQLAFATYEGEIGRLREEIKESNFIRDQIARDATKTKEDARYLDDENRRLKNELQKRFEAEELLKKSNEALRKGYDKLSMEKERLTREPQKTFNPIPTQNPLFAATPVTNTIKNVIETPEREKQREAVEKLIEEVDEILSNKKNEKKPPKIIKNKTSGKRVNNK